jgi:serine/threonine-protein kinase
LANAVARALEIDPNRRFANVAQLAGALLPFAPSRGRMSVERISKVLVAAGMNDSKLDVPPSAQPGTQPPDGTTQQAWGQSSETRRGSGLWVMVAAAVLLFGGAGVAAMLGAFSPTESATMPSSEPSLSGPSGAPAEAPVLTPEVVPEAEKTAEPSEAPKPQPSASAVPSSAPKAAASPAAKPPSRPKAVVAKPEPVKPPAATANPAPTKLPSVDLYQDRK